METNVKSLVHFDFQDGFINDTIILKVNGKEVFSKQNITTDLRISFAESFTTEIVNGQVKLDVLIPTKNLSLSRNILIDSEKYFGICIINHDTETPLLNFIEFVKPPDYR
jgi:hypothetical protein